MRFPVVGLAVALVTTAAAVTATVLWGGHGLEVASWAAGIASFLLGVIALLDTAARSRPRDDPAVRAGATIHIVDSTDFQVGDHNVLNTERRRRRRR